MDVREKLEVIAHLGDHISYKDDIGICYDSALAKVIEDAYMELKNGVTVQECGHWEDEHGDYVCSCCHTVFTDDLVWLVRGESNEPNYCPNCGAKMMPHPPKGE